MRLSVLQKLDHFLPLLATLLLTACSSAQRNNLKESNAEFETSKTGLNLHVPSPDWREQIIYFLMIDRFNDGDSSNNDQGSGEYNPKNGAYFSGGDLKGVIDKLDYIKQLGATSVWITPPVANQWWSSHKQSAGYHGYWAKDFKTIDAHFGTVEDYQQLSSELHNREMYLIQDIVTNHTGNFFNYSGKYDAQNKSHNFKLSEAVGSPQAAPTQYPFSQVNLNNPKHKAAEIYHWTPEITNYNDPVQENFYQLAGLADLNTSNPEVLKTLQQSYNYWIKKVGVDGFRIDTVKFVEHQFWKQFLHGNNGIVQAAKSTNRENFLNFGEVFEVSQEMSDKGEQKAASYLGTEQAPELNSVIGFPLFAELGRVFAQGRPTSNLAYRLQKHMDVYPNPYIIPNFVDNHDTQRFLSDGSIDALKQALFTIFTIPGIPVIYQGTEQAMEETREAMFKGGFHSSKNRFITDSEMFNFIKILAELRKSNKALTRGSLDIIAEDNSDSGVLSYKRIYRDEQLIVVMNSSDREKLVANIETGFRPGDNLYSLFSENFSANFSDNFIIGPSGFLTIVLPARSMIILKQEKGKPSNTSNSDDNFKILINQNYSDKTFAQPADLTGHVNWSNADLVLVINGDLSTAEKIKIDANGNWKIQLPVTRLGLNENRFTVFSKEKMISTTEQRYFTQLEQAQHAFEVVDAIGDDRGPTGNYRAPQHQASQQQMDIEKVAVTTAGDILDIQLTMKQVSTFWGPANGFDNVSFSLFFSLPGVTGNKALPGLNMEMPKKLRWSIAHVFYGWGNSVFTSEGATAETSGKKISASPQILVDKEKRLIRIIYKGQAFGLNNWSGSTIYLSTWDKTGEGEYRAVSDTAGKWEFTAASRQSPKVMDDVLFSIPATARN